MSKHPLSERLLHVRITALVLGEGSRKTIEESESELDRLHGLEAKLEEVAGLPGKWEGGEKKQYGETSDPIEAAVRGVTTGVRLGKQDCARDLRAALASTGPSLRERVENALADIRTHSAADYNNERIYAYDIASDLVQAALEGKQ